MCRNCARPDCPLLATIIIGRRSYIEALVDCMTAERAREVTPRQRETVAGMGRRR